MRLCVKQLNESRRLEVYAVIAFIAAFRREFRPCWITLVDMPKPPEPDFICRTNGELVGIEVAHLYGSERDARLRLGRSQTAETTLTAQVKHALQPLTVRIPYDLNAILSDKASKKYPRRTWLVIRNAHPVWGRTDFEQYLSGSVQIPPSHPFDQMWLLCDSTASSGMLRLFP